MPKMRNSRNSRIPIQKVDIEQPSCYTKNMKNVTINGKLDKVNLIKTISRDKIGTVPGKRVIPDKRFKPPKYKERYV